MAKLSDTTILRRLGERMNGSKKWVAIVPIALVVFGGALLGAQRLATVEAIMPDESRIDALERYQAKDEQVSLQILEKLKDLKEISKENAETLDKLGRRVLLWHSTEERRVLNDTNWTEPSKADNLH